MLKHGLLLGDTRFCYLCQSNSQIKQCSFWFLAQGVEDPSKLMTQFGEFEGEKVQLKKMARKGQIFSGTVAITTLEPHEMQEIPDIEHDGYNFTDGAGNISSELCGLIDRQFNHSDCSAYQVRIGGLKGVFVRNPDISEDRLLQWRPSQQKFKSKHTDLEIIRCATFSQGFLNRQVIMLMSCQGVSDALFLKKLKKAMRSMNTDYMMKKLMSKAETINQEFSEEDRAKLERSMRIFFGPSKLFAPVFKRALVCAAELSAKKKTFDLTSEPLFD